MVLGKLSPRCWTNHKKIFTQSLFSLHCRTQLIIASKSVSTIIWRKNLAKNINASYLEIIRALHNFSSLMSKRETRKFMGSRSGQNLCTRSSSTNPGKPFCDQSSHSFDFKIVLGQHTFDYKNTRTAQWGSSPFLSQNCNSNHEHLFVMRCQTILGSEKQALHKSENSFKRSIVSIIIRPNFKTFMGC